jgi:hypothetical protein
MQSELGWEEIKVIQASANELWKCEMNSTRTSRDYVSALTRHLIVLSDAKQANEVNVQFELLLTLLGMTSLYSIQEQIEILFRLTIARHQSDFASVNTRAVQTALSVLKKSKYEYPDLYITVNRAACRYIGDIFQEILPLTSIRNKASLFSKMLGVSKDEYPYLEEAKSLSKWMMKLDLQIAYFFRNIGHDNGLVHTTEETIRKQLASFHGLAGKALDLGHTDVCMPCRIEADLEKSELTGRRGAFSRPKADESLYKRLCSREPKKEL